MGKVKHAMAIRDSNQRREPIYIAWVNMRQRCNNKNKWDYKHYGGRGITYSKRWDTFEKFLEDMGATYYEHKAKYSTTTLDRIDTDSNYGPQNCKWSTRKEQSNNRNYNRLVTYKGRTQSVGNWAEEIPLDITTKNLRKRIFSNGWSVERAFTQPLKGK